jgi:hypothetical protein
LEIERKDGSGELTFIVRFKHIYYPPADRYLDYLDLYIENEELVKGLEEIVRQEIGEVKPRLDVRAFAGWYLGLCRGRATYKLTTSKLDELKIVSEILGEAPHGLHFHLEVLPLKGIRYTAHWNIERLREGVWREFGVDYAKWDEEVVERLPERLKAFDKKLAAKALVDALRNAEKEYRKYVLRDMARDVGVCSGDECDEIWPGDEEKYAGPIVESVLSDLEIDVETTKRLLTDCPEGALYGTSV